MNKYIFYLNKIFSSLAIACVLHTGTVVSEIPYRY